MLLVNRQQLLTKALDIENSVRGSLKVFGLRVGVVARRGFEARALELVADDPILLAITKPMLRVRQCSSKSSSGSIASANSWRA